MILVPTAVSFAIGVCAPSITFPVVATERGAVSTSGPVASQVMTGGVVAWH